jgi:Tol biopolymer transport system component
MECADKVFPHLADEQCVAGEFDHFTITQLTDFGERPVWSPDGKRIAFMDKEFGNAYQIELSTGTVECITCEFEHEGFLRIHYMKDGDFLLLGPKKFTSTFRSRFFGNGFFWMPADHSSPPQWLGEEHYEGVAVSKESRLIAYSKTWLSHPFMIPSKMYVAELTTDGKLINKRVVARSMQVIEAQDFLPGDKGLTFARYTPNYDAFTLDFESGAVINQSHSPSSEEPEGIFPGGQFTLMESDRHSGLAGEMDLDIYMLRLDGTGKDVRRLTHFTDTPDQKANNPVVSPDGCRIAFMKATKSESWHKAHGEGAGIYLLEFYTCASK